MANTYSQIYLHVVFAVAYRHSLIEQSWEEALYKYISGIASHCGQKLLAIDGMPDHIHILLSIGPDCRISDLMRIIKCNSSRWVNETQLARSKFQWQNGYGAFSVSASRRDAVRNYIRGQKEHHAMETFCQEYTRVLNEHEIGFDERYVFKDPE